MLPMAPSLEDVPGEILEQIISFLDFNDERSLAMVDQLMHRILTGTPFIMGIEGFGPWLIKALHMLRNPPNTPVDIRNHMGLAVRIKFLLVQQHPPGYMQANKLIDDLLRRLDHLLRHTNWTM